MRSVVARVAAVVASVAVAAATNGCRSSPDGPAAAPSAETTAVSAPNRNAVDVAFLQKMVRHHEQALDLSALVPGHTTNPDLIALMQQIASQQRNEMDGFRAQLLQWESPLVAPPGTDIDGMVDQATMAKLQRLHGAAFDKLWLQTMIAHHQGAIDMTRAEIAQGHSPDVISIAKSVAAAQQTEIDQMNHLLETQ